MPVDTTKPTDRRRVHRREHDPSSAREIELKRSRGEISCAECRRLKIKCDKQIPCQSCQRRGCAALCPNGSLATGQGTRFVIAATEHLHRRIARMSDRIRQLEDALSVLQASHSKEPHPILQDAFLAIDNEPEPDPGQEADSDDGELSTEAINAFGTMSISDHGTSRFFGPTGGSEGLLLIDGEDTIGSPGSSHQTDSSAGSKSPLSSDLTRFSYAFPFTPMGPTESQVDLIRAHLPPWELAVTIAETYLSNAAWLFRGVSRIQLMDEMLPAIYKKRIVYPPDDYGGPHDLALLLSIFAVGRIVDISLPQSVSEAEGEHYNQLALAALCLRPVLERPSMVTIQALHLSSIYNAMCGSEVSGGESSMETTWSLIALAAHLAQTVHRDSARWETNPKVVQRRRMLFWDLFIADSWHTLSTGRPPAFNRVYIDCQFPQDDEVPQTLDGGSVTGFGTWGFRFAYECVAEVAARTLTATAPRYSEIMDLDRKIREFAIPADALAMLKGGTDVDPTKIPLSGSMTVFVLSHTREVILLFIHRSFFAQALIEDPVNPIRSPYSHSFLASVRAASTILHVVREQFAIHPAIVSRFWSTWTYAFSAAIVFGVIVTRGPRSSLADNAMAELDQACDMFAQAAKLNRRAAKAHTILSRLKDKAHRILAASRTTDPTVSQAADGAAWDIKQEELDDELDIFAGRTKVLRSSGSAGSPSQMSMNTSQDFTPKSSNSREGTAAVPYDAAVYEHRAPVQAPVLNDWLARQEQVQAYGGDPYLPHPLAPAHHHAPRSGVQHTKYEELAESPSHDPHNPYEYVLYHPPPQPSHRGTFPPRADAYAPPPPQMHVSEVPPYAQQQYAAPAYPPYAPHPHALALGGPPGAQQQQYTPPDLAQLGLATTSGSSRMNETWTSFMQRSGILDGSNM
ncbi:hypothetical protein FA95DRAFT_1520813 [Auriscalpium vulgare]|uniref:Uncharacterized protein n=1 Tax=Auriscalpium vulgare TaxID=40419 RepID=A0ACB8RQ27_9AGAM|nr:hypothetical protein FA95DRAFT_1520813 [Auriscalpium vulgare]